MPGVAGWQGLQGFGPGLGPTPVCVSLSKLSFWSQHHAESHTLMPL